MNFVHRILCFPLAQKDLRKILYIYIYSYYELQNCGKLSLTTSQTVLVSHNSVTLMSDILWLCQSWRLTIYTLSLCKQSSMSGTTFTSLRFSPHFREPPLSLIMCSPERLTSYKCIFWNRDTHVNHVRDYGASQAVQARIACFGSLKIRKSQRNKKEKNWLWQFKHS